MTQRTSNQENSLPTSNDQTLSERLRDCVKVTFSAGLHGVESDCRQAAEELDRQRAEIERLTRQVTEWHPIETAPRGPACLFWVVPKSAEETWTDTSGWPVTARGEPYIVMGPYGDWGSLWKATHWMPLPRAPIDAPHCPTCGCGG